MSRHYHRMYANLTVRMLRDHVRGGGASGGGNVGVPKLVTPLTIADAVNTATSTIIISSTNTGGVIPLFDNYTNNPYIIYPSPITSNLTITQPKTGLSTNTKHVLFKYGGSGITIKYYKSSGSGAQDLKDTNDTTIAEQLVHGKVYLLDITITYAPMGGYVETIIGALTEMNEDISFTVE